MGIRVHVDANEFYTPLWLAFCKRCVVAELRYDQRRLKNESAYPGRGIENDRAILECFKTCHADHLANDVARSEELTKLLLASTPTEECFVKAQLKFGIDGCEWTKIQKFV